MLDTLRRELWGALLDGYYRLDRPLGAGATGIVFGGEDPAGQPVAVKLLRSCHAADAALVESLRREASVSAEVRHPGVVACLGQGVLHDGSPYLVFERIEGLSLAALLRRWGRLEVGEALVVAQRAARILAAVHAAGYVHRDVKPEHIFLSPSESGLQVRLLDFGVALAPGSAEPSGGFAVYGTPGYASPEQAASERVDARSDLFGLGATLFEALSGRPPFVGRNSAEVLTRTLRDPVPLLGRLRPDIPRALERLVQRLLARAPEARPTSARMVARELGSIAETSLALEADALRDRVQLAAQNKRGGQRASEQPTRRLRAVG